jgi:ribosomal-protein-alanine N-acetyltransferase
MSKSGYYIIGYAVVEAASGKGVCSEAVRMIVGYLFLRKKIVRVQDETHPENIASQRVLTKNGFSWRGLFVSLSIVGGFTGIRSCSVF